MYLGVGSPGSAGASFPKLTRSPGSRVKMCISKFHTLFIDDVTDFAFACNLSGLTIPQLLCIFVLSKFLSGFNF